MVGLGDDVVTAAEVSAALVSYDRAAEELLLPPPHAANDPARRIPARA